MTLDLQVTDLRLATASRTLLDIEALSLPEGQLLGIRGPSGAGKSTLLFALSGLLAVQGNIYWGDCAFSDLTEHQKTAFRAKTMGLVFQDFLLFDELDAVTNAGLPGLFGAAKDRSDTRGRAETQLQRLGVPTDQANVATLSGGERQRTALARALATDPQIVLADEPTAALDRVAADRLIDDLVGLCRDSGKTLITVSHDQRLLDAMDRVVTLENGRLA